MYYPHQNTSVDEAMIAFRGRLRFRQNTYLQSLQSMASKFGSKQTLRMDFVMNMLFNIYITLFLNFAYSTLSSNILSSIQDSLLFYANIF